MLLAIVLFLIIFALESITFSTGVYREDYKYVTPIDPTMKASEMLDELALYLDLRTAYHV